MSDIYISEIIESIVMLNTTARRKDIQLFKKSKIEKEAYIQSQRLLWEKSYFPERFSQGSIFLCSKCARKSIGLSICLSCGNVFCLEHFKYHKCSSLFGIDVKTRQLFKYDHSKGRIFIFDSELDRIIYLCKYSVLEGLPASYDHQSLYSPVFTIPRQPFGIQNLGNTCWIAALLQCFLVNPLLQKWFRYNIIYHKNSIKQGENPALTEERRKNEALHYILSNLFSTENYDIPQFDIAKFVTAIWLNFNSFATTEQHDALEFFTKLRMKLDDFYQKEYDITDFGSIFEWKFEVIESCIHCTSAHSVIETAGELILSPKADIDLQNLIGEYLLSTSPKICPTCQTPLKKQIFFKNLPPTLSIVLMRTPTRSSFIKQDIIDMGQFIDNSYMKKNEKKKINYRLISMVVRPGSGEHGHYFANVFKMNKWWRCDDNNVTEIRKEEALKDDAALLFFVREGFVN